MPKHFILSRRKVLDIVMKASIGANIFGDICSSNIGLTSNVSPEAKTPELGEHSQTGVSTRNASVRNARHDDLRHCVCTSYNLQQGEESLRTYCFPLRNSLLPYHYQRKTIEKYNAILIRVKKNGRQSYNRGV